MTHLKFWCHGGMDTFLTAKLKLHTTPEQFRALRQAQLAYRDGLNFVSRYAFEHGKLSNTITLTLCGVAVETRCKRPLLSGSL